MAIEDVERLCAEKLRLLILWDDHEVAQAAAKKMQSALTELTAQLPDIERRIHVLGQMPEAEFKKILKADPKEVT